MLQRMARPFLFAAVVFGLSFSAAWRPAGAATEYIVNYRLTKWKTMHFEDAAKAETHLATIKKLGCEVKAANPDGHIDVSYLCPKWRSLAVETDAGAHKWEKWLRTSGFETSHRH